MAKVKLHDVQLIDVELINKNDWNPNFLSKQMERAVSNNMDENGFLHPLVLQKHNTKLDKDYVIINGEHRYELMKKKEMDQIPSIIIDVDDDKAKALSIRLNREHGELFPDATAKLLKALSPTLDFGYLNKMTFMEGNELKVYTDIDNDGEDANTVKNTKTKKVKEVKCPSCQHVFELT